MRVKAFLFLKGLIALTVVALLPMACANDRETDVTATDTETKVREIALVRFVNATSYSEPVDVYLDQTKVIPAVGNDKVTDYSEWTAERHDIEVRQAGTAAPAEVNSESLSAGEHYTVVGFNKMDGSAGVAVFPDKDSLPEAGKAGIRLIHVADGADELEVYSPGARDSLVEGVNFNSEGFIEVDPAVRSLEIRKEGEKIAALKIPDLSLEPGKTTTIVVAADQDRTLRAIKLESGLPAQGLNK
jgi:hypothetical protein